MVKTSKTPVTLENLIPTIEKSLLPKVERIVKTEIKKFEIKFDEKIDNLEEKIKFLPTTEVYLKSQDQLMGELQKAREASEFTSQHYRDTNDRIDNIDKYIGFNSNIL